jgi:Radical SAM superfamily/Iron-sulfur cluster-binding domain
MNDFCVAPWTHTYISPQGERRLCCASREPAQNFKQYIDTGSGDGVFQPLTLEEWWNSEHVRQVRTKWLNGTVPSECEVCDKKLLNTNVYRDYFGHLFGNLRDDIIANTSADGTTTLLPISFDYRYSNVCNFKCRMCGDMLSSAWEAEVQKHDMVDRSNPKNNWMSKDNRFAIRNFVKDTVIPEFREAIESRRVREIYWVGGEPLLYDEHWTFMRRIVELGFAKDVRIRYNTNLSRCYDSKGTLWELLKHFPNWEICASLDGVGDVGEYIRTGLDYTDWLSNFDVGVRSQHHARQMRIDFTLTLPGLTSTAGILSLADTFRVFLLTKVVFSFGPDILLSPLALPKEILHPWIDDLLKLDYNDKTKSMREVLEHLRTRKTFAEEYPDSYREAARRGKKHLLRLESIRPETKITMEEILAVRPDALAWWRSIDE